MANPWGKLPLRMQCPHCGTIDEHPVIRTDPAIYSGPEYASAFFRHTVGRDIRFRLRRKRCTRCRRRFKSVEVAYIYLDELIQSIDFWTHESSELEGAIRRVLQALPSPKFTLSPFLRQLEKAVGLALKSLSHEPADKRRLTRPRKRRGGTRPAATTLSP